MKIGGSYQLAVSQEAAYLMLQDPVVLARCMPGCESLEHIGVGEYAMKMKMVLGAMSGSFDGRVRIADTDAPRQFRLIVEGSGKIGFMKGDGLIAITPAGNSCDVRFDGEVHVGGTIAAVGQRLIDTTARMLIKRFFDKLAESAVMSA